MSDKDPGRLPLAAVAAAVADTQAFLDKPRPAAKPKYAIPRTAAELSFRMELDKEGRVLFLFRRKGESARFGHRLRFEVLATPDRPQPAPAKPRAIELRLPPYLLPAELEKEIGEAAEHLIHGTGGAASDKAKGLVCFSLVGALHYLVVRVEENHKQDSMYLYFPEGPTSVPFLRPLYGPYRELFESLRAARREPVRSSYAYELGTELEMGWDHFDRFLLDLWSSYQAAAQDLSSRTPAGDPPVFFHVDKFQGEFYYSAWKPKSDRPTDNYFDAADDWIHNHIAVRHDSQHFAAQIELAASEFVLSGDVRGKLLALLAAKEQASELARQCSKLAQKPVEPREFESPTDEVLILLSYEKTPPTKGFLAVWPTTQGELLLTFDSDGEKLTGGPNAHDFLPSDAGEKAILRDAAHKVIHNFFRAIRLWRTRTTSG